MSDTLTRSNISTKWREAPIQTKIEWDQLSGLRKNGWFGLHYVTTLSILAKFCPIASHLFVYAVAIYAFHSNELILVHRYLILSAPSLRTDFMPFAKRAQQTAPDSQTLPTISLTYSCTWPSWHVPFRFDGHWVNVSFVLSLLRMLLDPIHRVGNGYNDHQTNVCMTREVDGCAWCFFCLISTGKGCRCGMVNIQRLCFECLHLAAAAKRKQKIEIPCCYHNKSPFPLHHTHTHPHIKLAETKACLIFLVCHYIHRMLLMVFFVFALVFSAAFNTFVSNGFHFSNKTVREAKMKKWVFTIISPEASSECQLKRCCFFCTKTYISFLSWLEREEERFCHCLDLPQMQRFNSTMLFCSSSYSSVCIIMPTDEVNIANAHVCLSLSLSCCVNQKSCKTKQAPTKLEHTMGF